MRPILPILILSAGTPLMHAQAIIEHGGIDVKTAAAAAGAGKSVLGVMRQLSNASEAASKVGSASPPPAARRTTSDADYEGPRSGPSGSVSATPSAGRAAAPASQEPAADFSAVSQGMERGELVRLFGKPSMSVSGVESHVLTETFWYQTPAENITVILREGKVYSITRVSKSLSK